MTRRILWAVIAVELVVGVAFVRIRVGRHEPPVSVADLDEATAGQVRRLAAECRTPAGWAKLADLYFAAGRLPEAEACYHEASASGEAGHRFRHAFALDRLGETEEAAVRFEQAVQAGHPRPADCWYFVGRNHMRAGRTFPQPELIAAAFAKCGDLPAARYELAQLAARDGRFDEALATAAKLAREFPDAQQPVALQYRIAVARGETAKVAALADRFERMNVRLPNPLDTESQWFERLSNGFGLRYGFRSTFPEGRATEDVWKAALAARWEPAAAADYAMLLLDRKKPDEAVKVMEDAVARAGPAFQLLWRLGEAYAGAGRDADARAAWARAAGFGTGPEVKDLRYKLATAAEKAGDATTARAVLPLAYLSAGIERHDAGKPAEAVDAFREAVKLEPRLAHGWFRLGESYRELKKPADAKAAYERCLSLDPDHGRAARAVEFVKP